MRIHSGRSCLYLFFLLLLAGLGCKKEKASSSSGISPNDFLSNTRYDQLIVEIQCVNGNDPTPATIDNLKSFMAQRLNKSAGISVVVNHIGSPGKSPLSIEDIRDIEKNNRTQQTHDRTLCAYFLFTDGEYNENGNNSKVLGVAYSRTSMVIFKKTIEEFSGGIGKPSETTLESTVSLHEFGHILGLTNNGTAMQSPHQDEANGAHCNNKDCLMYWSVSSSDFIGNLMGGMPGLDAQCLADLRANGGK